MHRRLRRAGRVPLVAGSLVPFCLGGGPALGQTVWTGAADTLFTNSANWTNGVPSGTTPGTFGNSSQTTVDLTGATGFGLTFEAGAPAYSFTLGTNGSATFAGSGVVNNSANIPVITLNGGDPFNVGANLHLDLGTLGNARVDITTGRAALTLGAGDGSSAAPSAGQATINVTDGTLWFRNASTAGNATIATGATSGSIIFVDASTAGNASITNTNTLHFDDASSAGNATITSNPGFGSAINFGGTATAANATIFNNTYLAFLQASTAGNATIISTRDIGFDHTATAGNATIAMSNSGSFPPMLQFDGDSTAGSASITLGADTSVAFYWSSSAGNANIVAQSGARITFQETATAGNATLTVNSGAVAEFLNGATGGTSRWIVDGGGVLDISQTTATGGVSVGSIEGAGSVTLGGKRLTVGGNGLSTTVSGVISGTGGSLVKEGAGTLTLSGTNTYTGGTILNAGGLTVSGNLASGVTVNGGALLVSGSVAGSVVQNSGSTSLSGTIGGFTMNGGTAVLNGTVTGMVTTSGGTLGGSGTLGGLVANGAVLMPGNSIGTLNINGNFTQNGGVYQVEVNAAGQSDRINATGTATIGGGATVQVIAASGNYARNTTYTILNAAGGLSGAYSGVSSNFAFLAPSLSYDANNVFLTLTQTATAFASGAQTANQRGVGSALDASSASASGDYLTVIDALSVLSTAQGPAALDAISGQQYADFGTTNVNTSAMFMNTLGQQMALARGASAGGQRVAMAMACEVEACDTARPLSAWFSGLGGLGSVQGDGNASTLTYNFGGAAAGIDYRLTPNILLGLGVGYTHGTQWVNSFMGQGWSDSVSVAAYGSFTPTGSLAGFYADALAGYAYFNNQMQRQIQIPGLQSRTASGSTGANQFLAQVETGYGLPVFGEKLTATPFARLQFSTTTQNGFNESGAQSLSLNVAQQTTNSLRTVFGAELASNLPLGSERQLGLALRLGWQHEYADTGRPITAAFSGAPSASFTVYGATPTRDAAIVGFSANTTVTEATQLYLRYDGTLASGTDNHAFTAGLRLSW